ncbi:MAG: site-2 protease family protein [Candidatus Yonathbacteria bacterium]|nr:site-2 protease family protein [Candidatus Yonathbacteria bacterium]
MSILLFIIILGILVFVHEFGHFIAAKKAGVRVDEFGIGLPPRLWKKKIGETIYSINLFPVGGFVKIFGENPDEESIGGEDSKRSLFHSSKLTQGWIISAGIIFNLLFAWVLITSGFIIGVPFSSDDLLYGSRVKDAFVLISGVAPRSPALTAGLKEGDRIVSLSAEGEELPHPTISATQDFIASHSVLTISYLRGEELKTVTVRPEDGLKEGAKAIGISLDIVGTLKLPVHQALYAGSTITISIIKSTVVGLFEFFKNIFSGTAGFSDISGPIGIVGAVKNASSLGFSHLIYLTALISINLAVINIFPFPALDGGRLFFIVIETIKRSPLRPSFVNTINGIGFALLILLMVVVTYGDIIKIAHQ